MQSLNPEVFSAEALKFDSALSQMAGADGERGQKVVTAEWVYVWSSDIRYMLLYCRSSGLLSRKLGVAVCELGTSTLGLC